MSKVVRGLYRGDGARVGALYRRFFGNLKEGERAVETNFALFPRV